MRSTDLLRWVMFGAAWLGLAASGQQLPQSPGPNPPQVAPHFRVLLDAAHGGTEPGSRISDRLLEKDLVLSLSVRLRSTLSAHGMDVVTTREADAALPFLDRAELANHAQASACLVLHATANGNGVHLYTSSLAPTSAGAGPRPWAAAQSSYITESLRLSSDISSAMGHAAVPVALGRTSIAPIDSLACPAVAVEFAPLAAGRGAPALPLSDPAYQARLVDALTGALEEWRADWTTQP